MERRWVIVAVLAGLLAVTAGARAAILAPPPSFVGHTARPQPVRGIPATPRNPHMAPNGRSEIHDDGWQTDAYRWAGPLGIGPVTVTNLKLAADCGSITFDARGRIVAICVGIPGPTLYMFDPATLAVLAKYALPPRQSVSATPFQDFTGGGYFYLDNRGRIVTATTTHHIWVIAENGTAPGFHLVRDYDLSHVLSAAENITSALPDWHGLLWFVTKTDGIVGTVNLRTGRVHTMQLGSGALGEIENSFAVDQTGGVYVATNRKLYRFVARRGGRPRITWQVRYPNSFAHKPGQVDDGTGTTPTVMAGGYVNIADNADPMDVVVYRTAAHLRRREPRLVCRVPVFSRGASDTENSLIAAGRSMIVENNYGYSGPSAVALGGTTVAGLARVDINPGGRGCRRVWTDRSVAAPTVVPKLSLAAGLVYTYAKTTDLTDPWYWTALSFRTGRVVYHALAGTGAPYNNNYAGIAIARDAGEYLGTLGGIISLRDR